MRKSRCETLIDRTAPQAALAPRGSAYTSCHCGEAKGRPRGSKNARAAAVALWARTHSCEDASYACESKKQRQDARCDGGAILGLIASRGEGWALNINNASFKVTKVDQKGAAVQILRPAESW